MRRGPDNPAPAGSASCASRPASNARPFSSSCLVAGLYNERWRMGSVGWLGLLRDPTPRALPTLLGLADARPNLQGLLRGLEAIARRRRAHGHQLLGGGRMERDRRIEVGLAGAHLDRDGGELDHLGGGLAHDVAADHAIGDAV